MAASNKTVDTTKVPLKPERGSVDPALLKEDTLTAATDVAASGALIEPTIVDRIDTKHPAVDDEPRKGMPVIANRIDFNDPTITGAEAVERNLKAAE